MSSGNFRTMFRMARPEICRLRASVRVEIGRIFRFRNLGGIAEPDGGRSFTEGREEMGKDVLENPELVRKLLNELIEEEKRKGEI